MIKEFLETTFGLFYVMTEGLDHHGSSHKTQVSIFLVLIDMGQVLRTITNVQFGWSTASKEAIAWTDIVFVVTELLHRVIPRLLFFLTAIVLIIGALVDTFYVAKIFKAGNVKNMLPVKLLRFLVGAIVTTLFTTVLEWVLFPTECLLGAATTWAKAHTVSELLHGEGVPCMPFASPEIAITLPTIVVTAIYVLYSLITMLLSFEINPLSRNPWAHSTGRVECLWTSTKVAAALLPYLSDFLSKSVVSLALLCLALRLLHQHVTHMPFHDLTTNVVRGGVYGAVVWLCLASVVSSLTPDSGQQQQWVLLALVPVIFAASAVLVHQRQKRIFNFVHLLRGEFAALHGPPPSAHIPQVFSGKSVGGTDNTEGSEGMMAEEEVQLRTVFDKFYDMDCERNRAFKTGDDALAVVRCVLYSRKREDLPFLGYLIRRALSENPECEELLIFQFLIQRIIVPDESQASHKTRLAKLQNLPLAIDNRYLLYAVNRRSTQDFAGTHLGKGAVSAINVMEFEGRMQRARKAHLDCISSMKNFWRVVRKTQRERTEACSATVEEMIKHLGGFDKAILSAETEYEWLLEKYSGSVTMLNSYAHFCDAVLNDAAEAEKRRKQAELLESAMSTVEDDAEDDEEERQKLEQAAASTATSDQESVRQVTAKYMQSWSHLIMASEVDSLRKLTRRVQLLMLTLILMASAGYFFTSFYLFRDIAKKNILLIDKTGLFRAYTLSSCFLLRNQLIAAHKNDTTAMAAAQGVLTTISEEMRAQHKLNYEASDGVLLDYYNHAEINTRVPVSGAAQWTVVTSDYWTLGNDMARRMEHASRASPEDVLDPNYNPITASPTKLSAAYLIENGVRDLIPAYETVVGMYERRVQDFGRLTSALVYSNAAINALLLVGIAFFVLDALLNVIQTVQSRYISCWLALTLRLEAVRKLYRFYHEQEAMINELESDAEDKRPEHEGSDQEDKPQTSPDLPRHPLHPDGVMFDPYFHGDRNRGAGMDAGREPCPSQDWPQRARGNEEAVWGRGTRDGRPHGRGESEQGSWRRLPRPVDSCDRGNGGDGQRMMYGDARHGNGTYNGPGPGTYRDNGDEKKGNGCGSYNGNDSRYDYSNGQGGIPPQFVAGRHFGTRGMEKAEEPEEPDLDRLTIVKGGIGDSAAPVPSGMRSPVTRVGAMLKGMGSSLLHRGSFGKTKPVGCALERRYKAMEVTEEVKATIKGALLQRQAWFSRRPVYVAALSLMLALCLGSILYPARIVDDLTNLGPTTNQAGRRRYLTRACVHYARELVLDDGFSRMDKAALHGALAWHLAELRAANRAVRLGDALGVSQGADWRNPEHNTIMYEHGCVWRKERLEQDCPMPGMPKVTVNGLYSMLLNFYDAVEDVMSMYGVDPDEATRAYQAYLERPNADPAFDVVSFKPGRLALLSSDENLQFILSAFAGDVFQGLGATLKSFQHETAVLLDTVLFQSRLLFACYMVLVVVVFYGTLFRKTMHSARLEAVKARGFVSKMPTYTLAKEETDVIRGFFQLPGHGSD